MMRTMKDSGFGWLRKIPVDWEVLKIKDGFYRKKAKAFQNDPVVLSLARSGVKIRDITTNEGQLAASYYEYNPVDIDDMLLNPMDLQSGANCSISEVKGVISPAYINLRYKNGFNPLFYDYYFKYQYWSYAFFSYGKGVSFDNRWTLNEDTLMNLPLLKPSKQEQDKIATFLKRECTKIDSILEDVQNQIDKLSEYKRSVIVDAVTKGVDKCSNFVDSGMKWIGKIPAHWKTEKIKYNFYRHELRNPGGMEILSVYREYGVIPKNSRDDNHNVTSEDTSKYKYVKPGYLVINKMKAWQGSMGVSDYEGVVSPAYFIYRFKNDSFSKRYVHYLLRSCYKDELRRISGGIREGQWDLDPDRFGNTLILIPPMDEQNRIVSYLEEKCSDIDSIISKKKEQLDVLEEYKRSLIYEYVTGKKEVPNE